MANMNAQAITTALMIVARGVTTKRNSVRQNMPSPFVNALILSGHTKHNISTIYVNWIACQNGGHGILILYPAGIDEIHHLIEEQYPVAGKPFPQHGVLGVSGRTVGFHAVHFHATAFPTLFLEIRPRLICFTSQNISDFACYNKADNHRNKIN